MPASGLTVNDKNIGEYPNRNKCIELAKGEFLILLMAMIWFTTWFRIHGADAKAFSWLWNGVNALVRQQVRLPG